MRAALLAGPVSLVACGDDQEDPKPNTEDGTGGKVATGGSSASGGNGTGGEDAEDGGAGGEDYGIPIYGGPFPDMMKAKV